MGWSHILCGLLAIGVLSKCEGLICTPETGNTCTASKYVTGQCVSGECECVSGAIANKYGCHKSFKPTISVFSPQYWSGEIRPDGKTVLECKPDTFFGGSYRWYVDGNEVADQKNMDYWVTKPTQPLQKVECAIDAWGALTERSDPIIFSFGEQDEVFKVKPVVTGMVDMAVGNATVTVTCDKIPASYSWVVFYLDGERMEPKHVTQRFTFQLTPDRFNKFVKCVVEHPSKPGLTISSSSVKTPRAPANDIPSPVVKGEELYYQGQELYLNCEFDASFGLPSESKREENGIKYSWRRPDGTLSKVTASYYIIMSLDTADAGDYECIVSYQGKTAKTSPKFKVNVEHVLKPEVVLYPKKPLLGGYTAAICSVPGRNSSSLDLAWKMNRDGFNVVVNYEDSVIQFSNNRESATLTCSIVGRDDNEGKSWELDVPVNTMSDSIKVMVQQLKRQENDPADFILSCDSDYATPGVVYEWFVDEVLKSQGTKLEINSGKSTSSVKCQMTFKGVKSAMSASFIIPDNSDLEPPAIKVEGPMEVNQTTFQWGKSYTLSCVSASQSAPHNATAVYAWKKGGIDLDVHTKNLDLKKVEDGNDGNYSCTVSLGRKSATSPMPLVVEVTGKDDSEKSGDAGSDGSSFHHLQVSSLALVTVTLAVVRCMF